jgi:flagellar hook-associated protein 2
MTSGTSGTSGVSTQGTRTFFFGGASRIDTSALIDAAFQQRVREADLIDIRVQNNQARQSSFRELQSLSNDVQASLNILRKSYGALASNSSFAKKAGTLTTSASGVDPSRFLGVALSTTAVNGTYDLEVVRRATSQKVGSSNFTDATTALGQSGVVRLGVSGGTTADITITAGMNLNDIAATINSQTTTTGVGANVLQTSPGNFQLVLSATATNKQITNSVVSGGNVFDGLGITSGGSYANPIQAAQSAQIRLDGVLIDRDNNRFDDVITGVEFNLTGQAPGVNITLTVGSDNSSIKNDILNFVERYNALREFVKTNQAVNADGTVPETAVLSKDPILSSLNSTIQGLITGRFGSGGATLSSLREIGITLDRENNLLVNEVTLDTALTTKFDEVKNIFETRFTSSNNNFTLLGNTSTLTDANVTFDITYSGGAITGVTANGVGGLFDIDGTSIIGKAGTQYEGLRFAYVGNTNASLTFTFNQGFADLAVNSLDRFTSATSGLIETRVNGIDDENEDFQTRADRIRERADEFRERLIDRYGRLEAQIQRSETILSQIRAILNLNNNDN